MFMRDVFKGIVRSHEVEAGLDEGELLTRCENVAVMTEGDLFLVSEARRRLGIRQDHFMSGEEVLQRAGVASHVQHRQTYSAALPEHRHDPARQLVTLITVEGKAQERLLFA
jgi:hypothetical protein